MVPFVWGTVPFSCCRLCCPELYTGGCLGKLSLPELCDILPFCCCIRKNKRTNKGGNQKQHYVHCISKLSIQTPISCSLAEIQANINIKIFHINNYLINNYNDLLLIFNWMLIALEHVDRENVIDTESIGNIYQENKQSTCSCLY